MDDKKIKILIAEDTQDILTVMADRLRHEGYDVVTAQDGQEAWEKIGAESPDIILLDLMMPKMDGYAVLEKLRREPPVAKWQPVIIVSAKGELQDMKRGFELEADHYITKPWRMEDILQGIRKMLALRIQRKSHVPEEAQ